jgi:bile acid:Na+ symporter, BASS family
MIPENWLVLSMAFAFMAFSMLSIGLQTTTGDLRALLGSERRLSRMLLANFILVPALGVLIVRTFITDPGVATAFLLLACTPGDPGALNYSPYIKGAAAFAGSSAFLLTCLAIFVSPQLLRLVLPGNIPIVVPYARMTVMFVALFLLPYAAGMALRRWREGFAARLKLPCIVVAVIAALITGWLIATEQKQAMREVGPGVILDMLGFILLSMLIGQLVSCGDKTLRPVYAISTGMRNVPVCLFIALYSFPDVCVQTPLVAFGALMVFPSMALYFYHLALRMGPTLKGMVTEKTRALRKRRRGAK